MSGRRYAVLVAGLAASAALVAGLPGLAAPARSAPTPATPVGLPAEMEPLADYQGQGICSPDPKPGALALADLIRATYGDDQNIWIPRDCGVGGRSEHKEGRAVDWMLDVNDPAERAMANAFLRWLLGRDESGTRFAMARRLGVMYIGWNNRIWEGYQNTPGWSDIFNYALGKPCSQTPEPQYSTAPCHRDHIHISLSWDSAARLTSFWGGAGTPLPDCNRSSSTTAAPRTTVRGLHFVSIEPVRAYDSTADTDTSDPCRLTQSTYGGVGPAAYVPVTGFGEVEDRPVRAALVRIRALTPNAPSGVYAWASGGDRPQVPVLTARIAETAAVETVVPVATDGTIALAVDAGSTAVTVDVLGYFVLPSSSTPEGRSGPVAAVPPTAAYSTRGSIRGSLQPGESRLVRIAGRGGLPAVDAAARMGSAWLTVTTTSARTSGALGISPRAATVSPVTVPVRRLEAVTAAIVTEVDARGRVIITNTTRTPVHVDITANGWSARAGAEGALFVPVGPVPTLDTDSGVGVIDDDVELSSGMKVTGVGAIPGSGVSAVVVQVRLVAGSTPAIARLWPVGAADPVPPAMSAPAGGMRTALLVIPLTPAGGVRWSLTSQDGAWSADARLSVTAVGYLST